MQEIGLGDGTYFGSQRARTRVRGGGYGSDAWVAKIVGLHPKYGLDREFVRADRSGLSGSGRSGSISWDIDEPGIYEIRNFCVGSTANNWEYSSFFEIGEDQSVCELSKAAVLGRFEHQDIPVPMPSPTISQSNILEIN